MMHCKRLCIVVFCLSLIAAACSKSQGEGQGESQGESQRSTRARVNLSSQPPATTAIGEDDSSQTTAATTTAQPATETTATTAASAPPAGPAPSVNCAAVSGYVQLPQSRMLVRAPATTGKPLPVVLVLHGYTGTPETIETTSGMTAAAQANGFMAVYPEGAPVPDKSGFGWNSGSKVFSNPGRDDVSALIEIIRTLANVHCADSERIILTGESNGAAMAIRAVCEPGFGNIIKAVVAVIPAVDSAVIHNCTQAGVVPTPFLSVASAEDKTIPYAGDDNFAPQEEWFALVASNLNKCEFTAAPLSADQPTYTIRQMEQGCKQPARLISVLDGTHTWPGGPTGTGGLKPGTFDTNAAIVAILKY